MARARTWTAPAAAVERERTRQVAGIGCNLNQTARWANTHASAAEAVAPLVASRHRRALAAPVPVGHPDPDAYFWRICAAAEPAQGG